MSFYKNLDTKSLDVSGISKLRDYYTVLHDDIRCAYYLRLRTITKDNSHFYLRIKFDNYFLDTY